MRKLVPAAIFFACAFFSAPLAFAQTIDFEALDFSLSTSPQYPAPGDTVRVTAESTLLDLESGEIRWYVNRAIYSSGAGLKEIDVPAGAIGSETVIEAILNEGGIPRASAEARIRPVEIDLLWESDSYVPPFYRGRSLPSAGTNIRLEAIPRFKRPGGAAIPARDLVYTWRTNDSVVKSISGRGKSKVVLPSPALFGTDLISVEIRSADGELNGRSSVRISSREPVLALYRDHPLFGVLYHSALDVQTSIPEVEATFAAVPYFAEARNPSDGRLTYTWRVNNRDIPNDPDNPDVLTINAERSSGLVIIQLLLTSVTNFFLESSNTWRIALTGSGIQSLANPFGSTPQ